MIKNYTFTLLSLFLCCITASAQAVDDNASTDQNTAVDIYVLFNDVTSGGLAQEPLGLVTQPTNGVAVVLDGGSPNDMTDDYITYTPNSGYNGVDSFVYQITDIEMVTSTATVYITVIPPATGGDPPVASDDFVATPQGASINIGVLVNDSFNDGLESLNIVNPPVNGIATIGDNGTPGDATDDTINYTPNAQYSGVDSFVYMITDINENTAMATVTIAVMATAEVPNAEDDTATTAMDSPVTINVLANDSFGTDGPGNIQIEAVPANGTVTINNNGTPDDATDDTIIYTPNAGYNGVDTFTYLIVDANDDADLGTVIISIIPDSTGEEPYAENDFAVTHINTPVEIAVLENDQVGIFTQLDGVLIESNPVFGTVVVNENDPDTATDNTITYTPATGFTGEDYFVYAVFDGNGIAYGVVTVTVSDNGIVLKAFFDINDNGSQDSGEPNFNQGVFHYEMNNNGTVYEAASSSGSFYIDESNVANTYDLSYSVNSNLATYYTVATPAYQDVTITPSELTEFKFAVTSSGFTDASIYLSPVSAPRPGFTYENMIMYYNNGVQPVSGTITFIHDEDVTVSVVSQAGITNTANGFTYDFSDLGPFETRYLSVGMQVPTIPNVALGNLLTNTVLIAVTGDGEASNNTSTVTQAIVGSYDPNDITESHGEKIVHSEFTADDYLTYTIRFENTGTANAENIHVENMLDAQLDENTIEMVDASNDYTLERIGSSLVWNFTDVQLPPSEENTQIGHGYLVYRIKPKPGYEIGDIIPNSAEIYFDFNPAIVTNTFNTEFVSTLSTGDIENNTLSLYPNPVKDRLNIDSKKVIQSVTVYNLIGQKVLDQRMDAVSGTLDVSGLGSGVYLVRTISAEAEKTIRIIKE